MGLTQVPQRRVLDLMHPLLDDLFAENTLVVENEILQLLVYGRCSEIQVGRTRVEMRAPVLDVEPRCFRLPEGSARRGPRRIARPMAMGRAAQGRQGVSGRQRVVRRYHIVHLANKQKNKQMLSARGQSLSRRGH